MKSYIRHLVECQCILKIFEKETKPIYHKFPVFSIVENDIVVEKYVKCNNCNAIHYVTEPSISEIMWGKDSLKGLVTEIDDIMSNLNTSGFENLSSTLVTHKVLDVSLWELVEFLLEEKLEGFITLEKNELKDNVVLKNLYIKDGKFKIKNESYQRYI